MDTYCKVTDDGGKTFKNLGEKHKHVDNHAIWIDPQDTDYYLVGSDGGIYESFDRGQTWHYKSNLPVTQFYRVAVDNALPFYNVYGGTQDNNTWGGPSRTINQHGICQPGLVRHLGRRRLRAAIDPTDPNIVYVRRPSTAGWSASTAGAASRPTSSRRSRRRRAAAALELGLAAHHQPALAHAALLRRPARLPQRRPRRHLDARSAAT